jgi:type IV pilus assembly protein PilE
MKATTKGFTLIELVIVVAIVAILAAIVLPSYRNYVFRAHRADGKELAMRVAAAEERYFTNRNVYTGNIVSDLQFTSDKSEKGYYTVAVNPANADQTYEMRLSPAGTQVDDKCGVLIINNTGFKSFSGDETNGKCW